ncbi:MAG: PAS domain-containing protein [Bacteroidetes bacterium]|nr:PAS domain-containing protein [Bacteroidota bacterium]
MKSDATLSFHKEKLLDLFSSFKDGIFTLDKNYLVDAVNPCAVRLLDQNELSIKDKRFPELFPSNRLHLEKFLEDASNAETFIDYRNYFPEQKKWFQFRAYSYQKEFSIFMKDISGQIQNEQIFTLEREVQLMQATQSSLKNSLDYLLKGLEKIFPGYHAGLMEIDPSGKFLNHLSSPSLPDHYTNSLNGIPTGPNSGSCGTASFLKKPVFVLDINKDPLWKDCKALAVSLGFVSCWSFPILDSKNQVMGSLGVYSKESKLPEPDEAKKLERFSYLISVLLEHKRISESIQLSNELYKTVLSATNDAIWDFDLTTNVMLWGNSLKKLFGHDSELQPYTLEDWKNHIHPEDRKRTFDGFMNVLQSENLMYWEAEYRFIKADGTYSFVYDRGLLIRNEQGKAIRMVGAMQDTTESKNSEIKLKELNDNLAKRAIELQASNNELEKFAYIASHDLKEPLRMISSFLQLFESKYENIVDAKGKEYIRFAVDGAERLKELINDLLEYSRLLNNSTSPELFDPTPDIEEVIMIFENEIKLTDAKITYSGLTEIFANRTQFLQLIQNFVGNAIKYKSEKNPLIHISCEEDPIQWIFKISDNGIGIEKEYQEKIFNMFQRLHSRSKYSGTGIGLAICKKIIDLHRGTLKVDSSPGNGSVFSFTLPKELM